MEEKRRMALRFSKDVFFSLMDRFSHGNPGCEQDDGGEWTACIIAIYAGKVLELCLAGRNRNRLMCW